MNKLFIIGLPRTGTTSISVALLDQGYAVAHTAFTKHAFELADVISDAPCFCDYQQLDRVFPNSKFVYLDRALDVWVPSMQMLLKKMHEQLDQKSGYFNPVLKRSFHTTFDLLTTEDPFDNQHLKKCYKTHQQQVFDYFSTRDDLLKIDISQSDSFNSLMRFLDITSNEESDFPQLNRGKQVDDWKGFKHPGKVNPNSAGKEHRKYFEF